MKQCGTLWGVSVGAGNPEWMTLEAVRVLTAAPVLGIIETKDGSHLALDILSQVVDCREKILLPLPSLMVRDAAALANRRTALADQIAPYLDAGQDVAIPNLGDVSIYSTFSYLAEILEQRGYPTRRIAGMPSFCAVAATLGLPLTTETEPLHIFPGNHLPLEQMLAFPGTKVLMKQGKTLSDTLAGIDKAGLAAATAFVSDCGLETESSCTDIKAPPAGGYFTTVLVRGTKELS